MLQLSRGSSRRPTNQRAPAVLILCLALIPSVSQALDPSKAVTQYVHRSWGTEDGLPQISAMALAQTPDGYLWIATQNGLARFDGVRFSVFDQSNTPQLGDNTITALRADRTGTLWIGTAAGVTAWRGGRFRSFGPRDGLPPGPIFSLFEARDGGIWLGSRGVVFERKGGRFVRRNMPVPGDVLSIAESDGAIWVAAYGGLIRIRGDACDRFTTANGLPDDDVLSLNAVGEDLWIGTLRGLAIRRGGVFHREVPRELKTEEVWAILLDRDRTLWFGTRHGLMRLVKERVERYRSAAPAADYIVSLLEDREGSLWAGTQLGGVQQFRDGAFTMYSKSEGLGSDMVWTTFDDGAGSIWFGTEGGGLNRLAAGRVTRIPDRDGLTTKTITALARDAGGVLWVGSWDRGLFRLRDGQWTAITRKDGLTHDTVTTLEVDGPTLWVGTVHGLNRLVEGHVSNLGVPVGLPAAYIIATHRDRRGRFWVATDQGLFVQAGGRFTTHLGEIILPHHSSYFIHESRDGALWSGTHTGLLAISAEGRARLLTTRNGLLQDGVWQMEEDRAGDFWLTSTKGIYRARRAELDAGRVVDPLLLGAPDGLKGGEATLGIQPASYASADGRLWFSTTQGAAHLDPAAARRSGPQLAPLIESVLIDGRRQPPDRPLDISPGAEKLAFQFTAPSFAAPDRLRFRYQLTGYDEGWIDAGSQRVAYYTHLPPGRYQFRVAVNDGYGNWSAIEARTALRLRPRFTQTFWFYLLCSLFAAGAVAALYMARMRTIRLRHTAVLAERNRIAREFHDTLAQDLASLSHHLDAVAESGESDGKMQAIVLAKNLTRQCLVEARRSLLDLRPEVIERAGLASALEVVVRRTTELSGIAVHLQIDGTPRRFDHRVEQHILRIAQEAVANAVKHSGAREIDLIACFEQEQMELTVADRGDSPASPHDSGPLRLGFLGIQERASAIHGRLTIARRPGGGTTVRLSVPIPSGLTRASLRERLLAWNSRS
jgi:ligand-binding sensor domain-containing protein/signal transduction histidine kinase